jgi:hypothetical protein
VLAIGKVPPHGAAVSDDGLIPSLVDRPQAGGVRGERGLQRLGQVL